MSNYETCLSVFDFSIHKISGRVSVVRPSFVEVLGLSDFVTVGSCCRIQVGDRLLRAQVMYVDTERAFLMTYDSSDGVGVGMPVYWDPDGHLFYPSDALLGRIIGAEGEPVDGLGPISRGEVAYSLYASPPPAGLRQSVGEKIDLGVRVLNMFIPCCRGQRIGIFAGSGVGKSVLLGMLARYTMADIIVIGLVGERGREVLEFVQHNLGEEGRYRSVLVTATSDKSPLYRKEAAYMTLLVAEYFRDKGYHVLCLIDSVTRFALAQREIGLILREPPATRGYTPSVFSELPRLLERAGPGLVGSGMITGLFTVLVDGDDHNEPVADAVRGILDGHIVLSRKIGEKRYPAVDVLKSISRMLPRCHSDEENRVLQKAKGILSLYTEMEELIRLGAYQAGSNPKVDLAIALMPQLESFLSQKSSEYCSIYEGYEQLRAIVDQDL